MSYRQTLQPVHWARWTGCAGVLDHPGSIAIATRCHPPGAHRLPPTALHIRKGTNAAVMRLSSLRHETIPTYTVYEGDISTPNSCLILWVYHKWNYPPCRPIRASWSACPIRNPKSQLRHSPCLRPNGCRSASFSGRCCHPSAARGSRFSTLPSSSSLCPSGPPRCTSAAAPKLMAGADLITWKNKVGA